MLSRRCIFLTRNFCLLRQPAHIIKHTLPCQMTRTSDFLKRFSSVNLNDDPPELAPKNSKDKLGFIKLEMGYLRDQGHRVPEPDLIKPAHWDELLKCKTSSARRKYYNYLFITEKKNENDKVSVALAFASYDFDVVLSV